MGADGESGHPKISNTGEEVISSYVAAETKPDFQSTMSPLNDAAFKAAETVDQIFGGWHRATDLNGTLEKNSTEIIDGGSIVDNRDGTYDSAVHCVFTVTRGQKEILHGPTRTSCCSAVYAIAGLRIGRCADCFYLTCNGVRLPPSDDSFSQYLVQGRAELQLMSILLGGNDSNSNTPPDCPTNPGPAVNISLPPPANLPCASSDISTVANPSERTVPENNGSASEVATEYVNGQSARRSTRQSVRRVTPKRTEEPMPVNIIYTMDNLPTDDMHHLEELLLAFHHDHSVQSKAADYMKTAHRHLEWETDSTGIFGLRYRVKLLIPKGTRFGYYSGAFTVASPYSNHCITAGHIGGVSVNLLIDACTARNATGDAGRLGLIQMLNHSCTPNCVIIPISLGPGLELFVAEALEDIQVSAEPTFNYDECATAEDKAKNRCFWRWSPATSEVPPGKQRIQCLCAGEKGRCPNKLWRDERPSTPVKIDWSEPSWLFAWDSTREHSSHQPNQKAVTIGTAAVGIRTSRQGSSHGSSNPVGLDKRVQRLSEKAALVPPTQLIVRDRLSTTAGRHTHGLPRHTNSRVQNRLSNCPSMPREVMRGVYVLPHLLQADCQDRLSESLAHLMRGSRMELANHNGKGVVPRGRASNPAERIEVDLSFLRSLDPSVRTRSRAHRRFVGENLESFRQLSAIVDGVMEQFRPMVEDIVGGDTSKWSYYAYASEALPGSPPQQEHQDRGRGPRNQYFTCIIPVTKRAEPTEFSPPPDSGSEYWKFQGPVLFDGHAWHRGPTVGADTRRVLSLVACKAREDRNHESATPFRWRTGEQQKPDNSPSTLCHTGTAPREDTPHQWPSAPPQIMSAGEGEIGLLLQQTDPLQIMRDALCELTQDIDERVTRLQHQHALCDDEVDVASLEAALRDNIAEEEQLDQARLLLHQATRPLGCTHFVHIRGTEAGTAGITDAERPALSVAADEPPALTQGQTMVDASTPEDLPLVVDTSDPALTVLRFELIDEALQTAAHGYAVNDRPYGRLWGSLQLRWRKVTISIHLRDEVRAARAEGSCYLLCALDLVCEAERSPAFRARRQSHPELQGTFQERWELLLGMATDRDALGLRQVICAHLLSKPKHFGAEFLRPPNLTSQQWDELRAMGSSLGISVEGDGIIQRCALDFLRPSTHADEGFMRVFLDWMDNKVAVLNLIQVACEDGSPRYLHSTLVDHITHEAVLLLKVLNIETGNHSRDGLNHFNRVSGDRPVEFLGDFQPESAPMTAIPISHSESDPPTAIGASETSALARLHSFDVSALWGPSQSCTRLERFHRLQNLSGVPAGWEWVKATLDRFPTLAHVRPGEKLASIAAEYTPAAWSLDRLDHVRLTKNFQPPHTLRSEPPAKTGTIPVETPRSSQSAPYAPFVRNKQSTFRIKTVDTCKQRPAAHSRAPPCSAASLSTARTIAHKSIADYFPPISATRDSDPRAVTGSDQNAVGASDQYAVRALDQRPGCGTDQYIVQTSNQRAMGDPNQRAVYDSEQRMEGEPQQWAMGDPWAVRGSDSRAGNGPVQQTVGDLEQRAAGNSVPSATGDSDHRAVGNLSPRGEYASDLRATGVADHGAACNVDQRDVDALDRQATLQMSIPPRTMIPGLTPWKPGSSGLYPRPLGADPGHLPPSGFPIWTVRIPGQRPQAAMFAYADTLDTAASSVFYVAADRWRYDPKGGWALSKIYGAFRNVESFIIQLLIPAPNRCFYEIIRANSPCKAYFDLEVGGGVLDRQQGFALCQTVITEWALRVQTRWPNAVRDCPRCLDPIILDGSRQTNTGWKVSYHLVYPFLTFPCNNTMLKEEVSALSNLSQLQIPLADGTRHRFIDTAVYSRNQLFRLPLNFKLSDETSTPLSLPGSCTVSDFRKACVTCLEDQAWRVPVRDDSRNLPSRRSPRPIRPTEPYAPLPHSIHDSQRAVEESVRALLRQAGQPEGRLQLLSNTDDRATFRWDAQPRPCSVAQVWRPANPQHLSNGAFVTSDSSRAVFLKCLHSECQKMSRGRGVFLGYLPPLTDVSAVLRGPRDAPSSQPRKRSLDSAELDCSRNKHPRHLTLAPHSTASLAETLPLASTGPPASRNGDTQPSARLGHNSTTPTTATGELSSEVVAPYVPPSFRQLTQQQGLLRVYSKNQAHDDGTLSAWTVESDAWGGRLGDTASSPRWENPMPTSFSPQSSLQPDYDSQMQAWASEEPFTAPPPARMTAVLKEVLNSANQEHSNACGGTLDGWASMQAEPPSTPPASSNSTPSAGTISWSVEPQNTWYERPLGSRDCVGHELLQNAKDKIHGPALDKLFDRQNSDAALPNLWDSPFTVAFLSVGFRRLRCSIPGVVEFLERYRPDVLFLGDLGVKRNKIGRLKLRIEEAMNEEWFLLTDIRAARGYPIGIGVLIHSSAAKYTSKIPLVKPPDVDEVQWHLAVEGRVFGLTLTRPGMSEPISIIGVNQHTASDNNAHLRSILLSTLSLTKDHLSSTSRRLICLGDFNAAPEGGRWGYSRNSKTRQADQLTSDWASHNRFQEVPSSQLKATWRACLHPKKAALDRAWVSPMDLPTSPLVIQWADSQPVFDHAMILLRLPKAVAGMGYAGASRPFHQQGTPGGCRVNLKELRRPEVLEEWRRLVHISLTETEESESLDPKDPFVALKHAELTADSIAYYLAPRRTPQAGDVRRSFGFAGHRAIFREMNVLRQARALVKLVLQRSPEILKCPHRAARWTTVMSQLHRQLRRSRFVGPPPTPRPAQWYFTPAAAKFLNTWMEMAKSATDVRWASVREDYTKAQFLNVQRYQEKLIRAGGMLDKDIIRNALGKRQPKQRMWGLQGAVPLGVRVAANSIQQGPLLDFLWTLPESQAIVQISGGQHVLQLWFRGPRALGDFVGQWCGVDHAWAFLELELLPSHHDYVAIVPDDMLAVQEVYMASEGMDSESVCFSCGVRGVQPIVTTGDAPPCGHPRRRISYFCCKCRSVHDNVGLAPMPPCPVPLDLWNSMRRINPKSEPLLARPVDSTTFREKYAAKLSVNKSPGSDRQPREYCKYGPPIFQEYVRHAVNAVLAGAEPTVGAEEWTAGTVTLLPKTSTAMSIKDYRPVAKLCSKLIIKDLICNARLKQAIEEYQLVDDVQEGFRRNRSAKRQLAKIHGILADQRRRRGPRGGLSVMLYLDIKNAFNAVNHRAIFYMFEAYGFPEKDVDLIRRMYSRSFLTIQNSFGGTAAIVLRRGVFQGAPSSPSTYILTSDPFHKIIRASGRGCCLPALPAPSGSSPFADDANVHTDGPDAIPAMSILVTRLGAFVHWLGLQVNMQKSYISAIDFSTGQPVATDSITLNGASFTYLPPDQPHKHLGVRMTMTGCFQAEKDHVRGEMQQRLTSLRDDDVLSPSLKELTIKVGVVSIFRYSAGLVPWSRSELDLISKMWSSGYKQAWYKEAARGADATPMILSTNDGGRDCPSACEVWIRDVLDLYDQCLSLPGEISQLCSYFLHQTCISRGCWTLNQLQRILQINGRADPTSVTELLMLRLNEQGLDISCPWEPLADRLLAEVLWPQLCEVWQLKETWAGCRELDEELQTRWGQAKQCLVALQELGKVGILTLPHLRHTPASWLHISDLRRRNCDLSEKDYHTFLAWVSAAGILPAQVAGQRVLGSVVPPDAHLKNQPGQDSNSDPLSARVRLPACIVGSVQAIAPNDQVELVTPPTGAGGATQLRAVADSTLITTLCRVRSVFQIRLNGHSFTTVECLAPLSRIWPNTTMTGYIVVQTAHAGDCAHQFAALNIALVRDSLTDCGTETLAEACTRDPWLVAKSDLDTWFDLSSPNLAGNLPPWRLSDGGRGGQRVICGAVQSVRPRRNALLYASPRLLPPWQTHPPLPDLVSLDLSNHYNQVLPCPDGWEASKRNARILLSNPEGKMVGLDAAHYAMLAELHQQPLPPEESFLEAVFACAERQFRADLEHQVPWNRHFLACLQRTLGISLLAGARAVNTNPHYQHFSSPDPFDVRLGSEQSWPPVPVLLLLDSYKPSDREWILHQAAGHVNKVWILRLDNPSGRAVADMHLIRNKQAALAAIVPARSLILHSHCCWSDAQWDATPSTHDAQIWELPWRGESRPSSIGMTSVGRRTDTTLPLQTQLGNWQVRRYDFYSCVPSPPISLQILRKRQQDAKQYTHCGPVAATDGSVNLKKERMGASFILVDKPGSEALLVLSTPVGGPLASLRAEAVGLLHLLRRAKIRFNGAVPLLIFIDCLALLMVLKKWGRSDFWPDPREVIHFDVIFPLLQELRQWTQQLTLVKIKSHSGCQLNEMADELADMGCASEEEPVCPGPQKYGSLLLRIQPSVREQIDGENTGHSLPRDGAPNKALLKAMAAVNTQRAAKLRSTIFVREALLRSDNNEVRTCIAKCDDSTVRCWMKMMSGTYPVNSYLHRIKKVDSPNCTHCNQGQVETLSHFLKICPRFHHARTAVHNTVRKELYQRLKKHAASDWRLLEESPMSRTGLRLAPVPTTLVQETGRTVTDSDIQAGQMSLSNWQPDIIGISFARRKIAIGPEVTIPSDSRPQSLTAAYDRKLQSYRPLTAALQSYIDSGWDVCVLPWVVGARGMARRNHLIKALEFLEIPKQKWTSIIECTVRASVEGLAYMHRIRFSTSTQHSIFDTDDPIATAAQNERLLSVGRKRRVPKDADDLRPTYLKWQRLTDPHEYQPRAPTNGDRPQPTPS